MEKGNLLICQERTQGSRVRYYLVRVAATSGNTVHGYLAKDYHIPSQRKAVEVVKKDVLFDLGQSPAPGKIYGVDVKTALGSKNHPAVGQIHFFYKPAKDVGESLMAAFDRFARILKKARLDFVLRDPLLWEIMGHGGSFAGRYLRSKKPDLMPHRIEVYPEAWAKTDYHQVMCHEIAHHLHRVYMDNPHLNAAWIKLFNTTIKPNAVSKEKCVELLNGMMAHDGPPSTFGSTLSDEDKNAFKWILRTIKTYRSLSVKELDLLMESGGEDDVREVWPKRNIPLRDLAPVVSEYATHSPAELIAEAVSFYLTGQKLPDKVVSLVERSLTYARKAAANGASGD